MSGISDARVGFGLSELVRRKFSRWKRTREQAKVRKKASQLREAARVMDQLMREGDLTRQQRREIFRKCASAQSFEDVFKQISPSHTRLVVGEARKR